MLFKKRFRFHKHRPLLKSGIVSILICLFFHPPLYAYKTERVVLVIIDGLRYSEGLGDPETRFVPNMAALAKQGAIVEDFQNDGITYTAQAIPAIWCGAWTEINSFPDPDCFGASNNYTELPTVFEYFRKHLSRRESDCIYILKELCPWKASFDIDFGPDFWPRYHSRGMTDRDVWQETYNVLRRDSPSFLLMYLADVDEAGHSGSWNAYTRAVLTADSIVGKLWETLQALPAYSDRTTLMVTNDHGRHDWNYSAHGDGCEGCRHIQFLAVGPDIRPGLVSETPRVIPDITPTIGELLRFETEYASGSPMVELFKSLNGVEKKSMPPAENLSLFPNPGNRTITLEFSQSEASEIELRVFDVRGQCLFSQRTFFNEGTFRFPLLKNKGKGDDFSSGTYIVQLWTATKHFSAKMVILK